MYREKSLIREYKQGFTLIELLIGLSLLSVIIVLGYNFLYFSRTTQNEAAIRLEVQQSLKQAMNFISEELNKTFYIEIKDGGFDVSKYLEDDKFIQSDGATITFHRKVKDNENKLEEFERTVLEYNHKLEFKKSKTDNVIDITIDALDKDGKIIDSLKSSVYAANMLDERANIDGDAGNSILYNNTTKESALPAPGISTGCILRRMVNDNPNHFYLAILREFRDGFLMKFSAGRKLVKIYYISSPKLADVFITTDFSKFLVRVLIFPIVCVIFVLMKLKLLSLLITYIFYNLLKWKKRVNFIRY